MPWIRKIKAGMLAFHQNEEGNNTVELAVLLPIIFLIVGFCVDRFIQYEGLTSLSTAANEAIRTAVVADSEEEANQRIQEILSERLQTSDMGWCIGNESNSCKEWGNDVSVVTDEALFDTNKTSKLLITTDKGWCNGSYITLGVRAHKSSVLPSYESFQNLLKSGGPIYHQHTYIIRARVEAKDKCS